MSWYGIDSDRVLKISISEDGVEFASFPESGSWEHRFFRLDDDLESVGMNLASDSLVGDLMRKYSGLRILSQDPEQCMFSFVCASNTNIPMIRRMLYNIARKLGKSIMYDGIEFFTFPSASIIDKASVGELRSCGLGYRAKAVKAVATKLVNGELDLGELRRSTYHDAKVQLLQVYGIGNKIADCILLFSLDKIEAFPIDVWIARALSRHYQSLYDCRIGEKLTPCQYENISGRMRDYFGRYAGYAQQYLYYDIRMDSGKTW